IASIALALGCASEKLPDQPGAVNVVDGGPMEGGGDATMPPLPDPPCPATRSAENAPARLVASSGGMAAATEKAGFVYDLFSLFKTNCGACHVEQGLKGFWVPNALVFPDKVKDKGQTVLDRIRSNDKDMVMPPTTAGGKIWSERMRGDPVVELADLIEK